MNIEHCGFKPRLRIENSKKDYFGKSHKRSTTDTLRSDIQDRKERNSGVIKPFQRDSTDTSRKQIFIGVINQNHYNTSKHSIKTNPPQSFARKRVGSGTRRPRVIDPG